MVKLVSARESRAYGPRLSVARAEYMNAGVYLFATLLLLSGFGAHFSIVPKSGLILILFSLLLIAGVNLHDLFAHLAGIDYRVSLVELDPQFALVELAVPVLQSIGCVLWFVGILLVFFQEGKAYYVHKHESNVMGLLIAGALLWLIGSIHNSCQIYERSDGHVQILQQSVHIPFLLGSSMFVVGAIINYYHISSSSHRGLNLLGNTWVWLGICGSTMWVVGGFANLVKVFKMKQMGGLRLEKLRGGAQERLLQQREGQLAPLILPKDDARNSNNRRRKMQAPESPTVVVETPYKDVLVGGQS